MSLSIARNVKFAALAVLAGVGLMQGAEQPAFHLQVPAHLGSAVLPPGDYKVSLPNPSIGRMHMRIEGEGHVIYGLPLVTEASNPGHSYLRLEKVGGEYFIREFTSGVEGKTFLFSVPKTSHTGSVAEHEKNSAAVTE